MSDNPFLLPARDPEPGGAQPAARPPAQPAARPAAQPARPTPTSPAAPAQPQHYIAVPASVESATHRIPRPSTESETAPETAPAAPDTVSEETRLVPTAETVSEETRLVPAAAARAFMLTLPDGTRLPLTGPLLLGRDPAAIPDRPEAQLLALTDPAKTVSKTHALMEPVADGVRIRELHSTNGVAVDSPAGREFADAGGELLAPAGSTILLGSFAIAVATGAAAAGGAAAPVA